MSSPLHPPLIQSSILPKPFNLLSTPSQQAHLPTLHNRRCQPAFKPSPQALLTMRWQRPFKDLKGQSHHHQPTLTCVPFNTPTRIHCKGTLINDDVTAILKNLCDTKVECSFEWAAFGQLKCQEQGHYNKEEYATNESYLWTVDANNQALDVTFVCEDKRNPCK